MMASLQYAIQILFAVFMVTAMFVMLPRAAASAERINEVLDVVARRQRSRRSRGRPARPRGHVEFQDVTFQYPGRRGAGAVRRVVHGTAGRSDGDHRRHRLGQVDAGRPDPALLRRQRRAACSSTAWTCATCAQEDLRARIGFVPQKAVLFSGTIASNIRFGRDDATDDEVRHAATVAQAAEFIDQHAGGYAVAGRRRAAPTFGRPEAAPGDRARAGAASRTSTCSTTASRRSTSPPTPGCAPRCRADTADATVFIVSQRIGTVMNADRIVVLDDGRVAGIGTHAELLETCDVYREIAESQASLEEVA